MKIYVINMERSVHRRKSMEEHLASMGLEYQIVKAVDGSLLADDYPQEPMGRQDELSKSELGCMLSHMKVYGLMQENKDEFALVLEDDVLITELNMPTMFETLKQFLSRETVTLLTYFGLKDEKVVLKKLADKESIPGKSENYHICKPSADNNLARAGAYIIPKSCAAKILDFHGSIVRCRADEWEVYVHHDIMPVVNCLYPMPISENYQHGSEIDYTRNNIEALGKRFITWSIYKNIPILTYLFKKRRESYTNRHKNIIIE